MNGLRDGGKLKHMAARKIDANPLVKMATRGNTEDLPKAKEALELAKEAERQGVPGAVDRRILAERNLNEAESRWMESTTGNRFVNRKGNVDEVTGDDGSPRTSWGGDLRPESATGERALAANAVQAGMGAVGISGEARPMGAVAGQVSQNLAQEGVEQGAKYGYSQATNPSGEERDAAEERGFRI